MNKHQKESISIPVFSVLCAPAVYENPEASLQQFLNKKSEQAAAARQLICQRRWKQAAWSFKMRLCQQTRQMTVYRQTVAISRRFCRPTVYI
ncbi:hypothetical protein ANACOL_03534 [Anaerotruncus colihominis DSM 17241]|uniref:Uncharacterized protein n=1 Tax=Anaerotruncus colihominis DSM 17241 TaxID=445972 RepID=B0PFF4_9FIRM|nr:hypothetical protein ANACOL_03534 [Anaerotruncus colihominis DSM 17241]